MIYYYTIIYLSGLFMFLFCVGVGMFCCFVYLSTNEDSNESIEELHEI